MFLNKIFKKDHAAYSYLVTYNIPDVLESF